MGGKKIVKNKSSVFILPMILGVPYKYFSGFENCYIGFEEDNVDKNRRIYLVFKKEHIYSFKDDRLSILKNNNQFIRETTFSGNTEYSVFTYRVIKMFEQDFDKFITGKYSKFSDKYKSILKSIYKSESIRKILSPSKADRKELMDKLNHSLSEDCEIFDTPYIESEVYSIAHLIEVEV